MPKLWNLESYRGEPVLVPAAYSLKQACIAAAEHIPGADWDDSGGVTGPWHALAACLEAGGGSPDWERNKAKLLDLPLPPFQQGGAGFTAGNIETGVLNNDDVGLGKTVQTIGAMSRLDSELVKVVLCPAFLKQQWEGEVQRWCPKFGRTETTHVIWPKGDKRSQRAPPPSPDWVIAFYLDAERAMDCVGNRPFILIADEIHNVRGWKTQRMEALQAASTFAAGRLGLTASRLYNDAAGIYPLLQLVQPGYWGNYSQFVQRYAGAVEGEYGMVLGKLTNVAELRKRLGCMSFRRTREDVYAQLPFDTKFQTVWLDMPGKGSTRLHVALASPAALIAQAEQVAAFKVGPVLEYIQQDLAASVPSITFTWTRQQAKDISARLPDSMLVLGGDGSTLRLKRIAEYVSRCKSKGVPPHVIGTYDALGEGANLQWAKVVNLASLDYTPDKVKQAIGRAARMGQEGTVIIRLFSVRYTLDEHMGAVLKSKLAEQFKLDGRKELDKGRLDEALGATAVKASLKEMYLKALREEQANG